MRTLISVTAGLVLSFVMVFASKALGRGTVAGAIAFLALWLIFCVVDFMNGVKAGYSALDELGIHILLFTVPAVGAWLAARFLS
jgi:hypothetical protein